MVVLAFVLLVAVLAYSLVLLSRLSRQIQADPAHVTRAVRDLLRRRPVARGR